MGVTRAYGHALGSMLGQGIRGCGPQTPTRHVSQIATIPTSGVQMTRNRPPTGARAAIETVLPGKGQRCTMASSCAFLTSKFGLTLEADT